MIDKKFFRHKYLAIRDSINVKRRTIAEDKIKEKLKKYFESNILSKQWVAIYYPIASELNIIKVVEYLDYKFLLPVVQNETRLLKFYQWGFEDKLVPGKIYNKVLEPALQNEDVIPDIIIVPLIAADLQGNRIGYGKGIYDYTIKQLKRINPNLKTIGLCFQEQIVDELPHNDFDEQLDVIISDQASEPLV